MRFIVISGYLGLFVKINALVLAAPALVALYYDESTAPFLAAALISFAAGYLLSLHPKGDLNRGETMALSALTLMLVSFAGAIPFYMTLQGDPATVLVDGFFESVSGYTTTGLSVIDDLSVVPKSILFLRSLQQWIGGLGIMILAFSALMYGVSMLNLYREEHGEKIMPSVKENARILVKIYVAYTVVGTLALALSGVGFFTALNNSLSLFSTGGFNASDHVYSNGWGKALFILFMVSGSIAFKLHYRIFKRDLKTVFGNLELQALATLILIGCLIFPLALWSHGMPVQDSLEHGVFNMVSALTTTGYTNIDYSQASDLFKLLTTAYMLVGGGMGSTAGGLKLIRFIVLANAVWWFIRKSSYSPNAVVVLKLGDRVIKVDEIVSMALFFFTYACVLSAGTLVLAFHGVAAVDSLFVSASALGTVGLSSITISSLPLLPKLFLALEMILGRLELIAVIALAGYLVQTLNGRENI